MKQSRKLIEQVIAGECPDHTPIFDLLSNDAIIEHFGGMPLDGNDDLAVVERAAFNCLDATRSLSPPNIEGEMRVDWMGNRVKCARWTTWIDEHALATVEDWKKWLPGEIERLECQPEPTEIECTQARVEQLATNERLGETVNIHCTPGTALNEALFGYHCGLEMASYIYMEEPELLQRWLKAIARGQRRHIAVAGHRETGPLAMIYSDIAFKGHLMFSRPMLDEWRFFDDVAQICADCHERDLTVIFHSDGYVMDIMDDLIAAGIDGFNPIEKAAGMDVYELRQRYPELILVGGLDVTDLLPHGTPEQVRAETARMIAETGSEGRLLIGSSTELGNDVPLENYLAFHDEVLRGMPARTA